MPTKKEVFIDLMNLLKTNISEVSNRVYSSYPKKKVTFPFIIVSNPEYSEKEFTISNEVILYSFVITIYIYTKTSQELDELTQKVIDLLKNNDILGSTKEITEEKPTEYNENNSIIHEGAIIVELEW